MVSPVFSALPIAVVILGCAYSGAVARPSEDFVTPATGRHLVQASGNQGTISENPAGPSQAACSAQGLACCYSPTWWLDQQLAPSVSCTDGTLTSDNTVDVLLQACEDGYIGIPCYQDICPPDDSYEVTCEYFESTGDYTGQPPCTTQEYQGSSITVYDPAQWQFAGNDEVVWGDVSPPTGSGIGEKTCYGPGGTIGMTGSYSKTSSWNVGIQLGSKIFQNIETKLTAGFSQSYTEGTSATVSVDVPTNFHGTLTKGTLVHHSIGWWQVSVYDGPYEGCNTFRVDNVASDLIMPQSDYRFPIGFGTEVRPCGYPLLNGHIN
ncbi:TPA: hypothetical protein ACH3X2_010773 [Trebouxia sp. C0005]